MPHPTSVQSSYPLAPPTRAAGLVVNTFGDPQFISRALATRQLEEITIGDDGAAESYTIDIDSVEVAEFTTSGSNTAEQIVDALLSDLIASGIVAEKVGTTQILIEAPGDGVDAGFVIALSTAVGTFAVVQLVEHAQEVPFGLGLVRDDRAPGAERRARLPRLATDVTAGLFLGIAAKNVMNEPNANGWPHLSMPDIMRVGHIYVTVEGSGVEGANLFVRHASGGGGTQLGAFRVGTDTSTAVAVPGLRALEDWAAGGVLAAEFFPQT